MKYVFAARCRNCFSAQAGPLFPSPSVKWNTRKRIGISNCNLHIYLYICYGIYRYVYRYCIYNLSWLYLKVSSSLAVAYRLVRTPAHVISYIYTRICMALTYGLLNSHTLYRIYQGEIWRCGTALLLLHLTNQFVYNFTNNSMEASAIYHLSFTSTASYIYIVCL